jgi:hypothetical protein
LLARLKKSVKLGLELSVVVKVKPPNVALVLERSWRASSASITRPPLGRVAVRRGREGSSPPLKMRRTGEKIFDNKPKAAPKASNRKNYGLTVVPLTLR